MSGAPGPPPLGVSSPEEYAQWNDDAAYEVITAMLTREGAGQHFVTGCFDQASLERLFLASIKNFLIDEAKKSSSAPNRPESAYD